MSRALHTSALQFRRIACLSPCYQLYIVTKLSALSSRIQIPQYQICLRYRVQHACGQCRAQPFRRRRNTREAALSVPSGLRQPSSWPGNDAIQVTTALMSECRQTSSGGKSSHLPSARLLAFQKGIAVAFSDWNAAPWLETQTTWQNGR